MVFAGTGAHTVYALRETGELRRVDLDGSTISSPILTGVESSKLGDDRLSYLAVIDGKKSGGNLEARLERAVCDWHFAMILLGNSGFLAISIKIPVVLTDGKNMTIYRGEISDSKDHQRVLENGED